MRQVFEAAGLKREVLARETETCSVLVSGLKVSCICAFTLEGFGACRADGALKSGLSAYYGAGFRAVRVTASSRGYQA